MGAQHTDSASGKNTNSTRNSFRVDGKLLTTFLLILLTSVSLVSSWAFVRQHGGFKNFGVSQVILTYSPTIILTIFVSIWRQIDYSYKTSAPWEQLKHGQSSAASSVLLDYVSTLQVIALFTCLRHRHVSVGLSISGFLLLKLSVIISTGLLFTTEHLKTLNQTIPIDSVFSGVKFNGINGTVLQDESLLYTSYGLMAKGLKYPLGVGHSFAYTTFDLSQMTPAAMNDASFSTSVEAFYPVFECVDASIQINLNFTNTTDQNPEYPITLAHPGCETNPGHIYALNPSQFLCPSRQLSGTVHSVQCNDSASINGQSIWKLLTLTDMRYTQTLNDTQPPDRARRVKALDSNVILSNVTSILCKPSYSIGSAHILGAMAGFPSNVTAINTAPPTQTRLEGLSDDDLSSWVDSAVLASADSFGRLVDNAYAQEYPNALFKLMASLYNNTYESLFDESAMKEAAKTSFQHLAVQIATKYLTSYETEDRPTSELSIIYSTAIVTESFLSLWFLIAVFSCVLFISVALFRSNRRLARDWYPKSMLDYAMLSKRSSFIDLLNHCNSRKDKSGLLDCANQYVFYLSCAGQTGLPSIAAIPIKNSSPSPDMSNAEHSLIWWQTITSSRWFSISTFVYSVAVLVVLELLQFLSDSKPETLHVSTNSELLKLLLSRYLPAITVLLLATMFNCLDFNTTLMDQFNELKVRTTGRIVLRKSPLGRIPIQTFCDSIWRARWPVAAASVASFIGTLLTIVVAGLYSLEEVNQIRSLKLSAIDGFSFNWTNSVLDDRNAAISMSLNENLNLTYPLGTFDELALSQTRIVDMKVQQLVDPKSLLISVRQPAYRARLDCEELAATAYSSSLSKSRFQQSMFVNATYKLPPDCAFGGSDGNLTDLNFGQTFNFALSVSDTYFAKLLDLHVGPFDPVFGDNQGETVPEGNPDNPAGCPSLAFIYGFLSNKTSGSPSMSIQVCYQKIELIMANVTLQTLNLSITNAAAIDHSATSVNIVDSGANSTKGTSNHTAFQFRIQKHFDTALSIFNNTDNPFAFSGTPSDVVDNFFQGVFFGKDKLPIDTLKLSTPAHKLRVLDNIQSFYRRYMAQAISSTMRIPIDELSQKELEQQAPMLSLDATVLQGISMLQLKQNRTSKWILQGMICLMICLGGFAVWRTNYNTILPFDADPCTIWGQMRLWANSDFCENALEVEQDISVESTSKMLPKDLCVSTTSTDQASTTAALIKDREFRLGWWQYDDEYSSMRKRYGVDVELED